MTGNFDNDIEQEQILTPIVIDIITDYLQTQKITTNIINFDENKKAQLQGIDFTMYSTIKNKTWNVDLKCQTNKYVNNPTNTFCLELCYTLQDEAKAGWFIKKDNLTDYYLFAWLQNVEVTNGAMVTSIDQINEMDLMFVYKKDIYDYFRQKGFHILDLLKDADKLVQSGKTTMYAHTENSSVKMVYSKNMVEKPVNIILSKYIYFSMPKTIYLTYSKDKGIVKTKHLVYYTRHIA
jgi:hypothetical protein